VSLFLSSLFCFLSFCWADGVVRPYLFVLAGFVFGGGGGWAGELFLFQIFTFKLNLAWPEQRTFH
jgi:hypothetical protein